MSAYICCIEMEPTTHSVWVFVRLCISIWNRGERLMFYQSVSIFKSIDKMFIFRFHVIGELYNWIYRFMRRKRQKTTTMPMKQPHWHAKDVDKCVRIYVSVCVWKSQIFRWKCGRIFFSPSTNPVYPVLCLSHFISSSFEINIPNHGASLLGMLMHVCMLIFICLLWLPQLTIQFTLGHTPNNMELHRMNLYISVYRRELDRRDRKREREKEKKKNVK